MNGIAPFVKWDIPNRVVSDQDSCGIIQGLDNFGDGRIPREFWRLLSLVTLRDGTTKNKLLEMMRKERSSKDSWNWKRSGAGRLERYVLLLT